MLKSQLIEKLQEIKEDFVVVCMDEQGGWDNIESIELQGCSIAIIFGGGSPFTDDK